MGLYDILKQKKKSTSKEETGAAVTGGEPVVAHTREEFIEFCESLKTDFRGIIKLYNRGEGKRYAAALLLEGGSIIGASFEDMDNKTIVYGEDALTQIKERLAGTRGDLEAYSFQAKTLKQSKRPTRKPC